MSPLLRVRGFYWLNKQQKNYYKIAWIAQIAASQIVADHKGNAFIMEKIVKNCYAFDYYHCYLSTVLDQDTARYRMCSEQEKRVSLTEPYTKHS